MAEEKKFIYCPVCAGEGKNKAGSACPNCSAMALGTFMHNRFFYWGPKLARSLIELDHLRTKFHVVTNIVSYVIGFIGLAALGYWVYGASTAGGEDISSLAFWREPNMLIFIFWLSLIADMFVVYRMSEEIRAQHKIKKITYEEKSQKVTLPDNWDELRGAKSKLKIDVSRGYTLEAIQIVEEAFLLADKLNHEHVTPLHLFYNSLVDKQVAAVFSRLNVDSKLLINKIKDKISNIESGEVKTRLSRTVREILVEAYQDAVRLGQKKVSGINFIIPTMERNSFLTELLYEMEIDKNKIFNVILWFIINEKQVEAYRKYKQTARFKPSTNMDRAYTSVATPALTQMGYDLTVAAKWGKLEFCVARENEINAIWQNIESGANGIILVGPSGVGKSAIIDGIAQLMVREDVPKTFQDKRLVELDASRLISGANPAQAQGRLQAIIDEVVRAGNIILFIDNIENIIGITSGAEQSLDLSEVLSSAVEKRMIYCLASVTEENYTKYVEGGSLAKVLAKIEVNEPEGNQAIQIIESKIGNLEGKYKVYFSYDAIDSVIKLSTRYIHDKYLPDKAIEILELVAVKAQKIEGENTMINRNDIAQVVSEITKIPVTKIGESEGEKLLNLEDEIHKRMIAQTEAVKMVSASLRRARTEMREGKRPIANFLFLGPTGVGKTELAKSVSEVFFGDEEYMIRIDMSEYQHPDSIKKMIGDAQGAQGYLTEAVRKSPFALVLLDEVEKAHPDILNLFLQVMDDGRLTDGQGRTIDFTSSIVIATSNAGANFIQEEIYKGTDIEEIKTTLINEHLNKVMRPELINRFDGVIVFEPLGIEEVVEIAHLMLKQIKEMLEKKGIDMKADEEGVRILAKAGFDPKFGARPLRRLLQERVEDAIANKILSKELVRRDTVVIDSEANVIVEKGKKL